MKYRYFKICLVMVVLIIPVMISTSTVNALSCIEGDCTPPSITSISYSGLNAYGHVDGGFSIIVKAHDNYGGTGMYKVVFYVDGSNVGTVFGSGNTFIQSVPNYNWAYGTTHYIMVTAYDIALNYRNGYSSVTEWDPIPSISLTYPANGQSLIGMTPITATASVSDGSITGVNFYAEPAGTSSYVQIGSDTSAPYTAYLDASSASSTKLFAYTYTSLSATAETPVITVNRESNYQVQNEDFSNNNGQFDGIYGNIYENSFGVQYKTFDGFQVPSQLANANNAPYWRICDAGLGSSTCTSYDYSTGSTSLQTTGITGSLVNPSWSYITSISNGQISATVRGQYYFQAFVGLRDTNCADYTSSTCNGYVLELTTTSTGTSLFLINDQGGSLADILTQTTGLPSSGSTTWYTLVLKADNNMLYGYVSYGGTTYVTPTYDTSQDSVRWLYGQPTFGGVLTHYQIDFDRVEVTQMDSPVLSQVSDTTSFSIDNTDKVSLYGMDPSFNNTAYTPWNIYDLKAENKISGVINNKDHVISTNDPSNNSLEISTTSSSIAINQTYANYSYFWFGFNSIFKFYFKNEKNDGSILEAQAQIIYCVTATSCATISGQWYDSLPYSATKGWTEAEVILPASQAVTLGVGGHIVFQINVKSTSGSSIDVRVDEARDNLFEIQTNYLKTNTGMIAGTYSIITQILSVKNGIVSVGVSEIVTGFNNYNIFRADVNLTGQAAGYPAYDQLDYNQVSVEGNNNHFFEAVSSNFGYKSIWEDMFQLFVQPLATEFVADQIFPGLEESAGIFQGNFYETSAGILNLAERYIEDKVVEMALTPIYDAISNRFGMAESSNGVNNFVWNYYRDYGGSSGPTTYLNYMTNQVFFKVNLAGGSGYEDGTYITINPNFTLAIPFDLNNDIYYNIGTTGTVSSGLMPGSRIDATPTPITITFTCQNPFQGIC